MIETQQTTGKKQRKFIRMPSKKMMELGKAWAAQRKRKGVTKVISTLPGGQRAVDKKYLETQLFVSQDGGMAVHIVQQLAKTGAAGLISQLIAAKVNLDDPDHTGRSAVHYAASKGQGIALQELLSNGASANCQDRQGKTPLHLAVQAGNSLMVKELVLAKASLEVRDRAGRSPLLTAILCEKRSRETPGLYTQSVVTYLTAVGAVLGTADQDGRNAYHYAVLAGDTSMLHGLCEKASVPLPDEGTVSQSSSKSVAGLTSKARAAAAAAQAKAKAAAEAMNSVDAQGVSPLGLAASRGFVQAVEQLLSAKAEVNRADGRPPPGNLTPLHWAIVRCCMPACRLLIDAKADLSAVANAAAAVDSTAQENEWVSPLGLAARCGFRAMVSHLLCDQNVPFEFGMPRKVSGVDSVDVPTILQCAPAGVVAKYQAALAAHTRERETKRRPAVEKVLSEPVLFDGQKLARGKAGESFEDFAEKLEERREILRNARSAELQKAADNAQFKGQAESVEAFLERQVGARPCSSTRAVHSWNCLLFRHAQAVQSVTFSLSVFHRVVVCCCVSVFLS